jgi:hypothetical protein
MQGAESIDLAANTIRHILGRLRLARQTAPTKNVFLYCNCTLTALRADITDILETPGPEQYLCSHNSPPPTTQSSPTSSSKDSTL